MDFALLCRKALFDVLDPRLEAADAPIDHVEPAIVLVESPIVLIESPIMFYQFLMNRGKVVSDAVAKVDERFKDPGVCRLTCHAGI